jgi:hypothetical protein
MQPHPKLGMLSLAALPVGVRALSVLTVSPMKFRPIKFRTFILPLALAAGLVLVLGVGLLGGLALRTPLYLLDRGGQSIPEAFQFVPKQSALVASVLARPDRLAQLWDYLADPKQRPTLRTDRERLERAMLAQTGLTYERDLQPWLGEEITVASGHSRPGSRSQQRPSTGVFGGPVLSGCGFGPIDLGIVLAKSSLGWRSPCL